MLAKLRLRKYK